MVTFIALLTNLNTHQQQEGTNNGIRSLSNNLVNSVEDLLFPGISPRACAFCFCHHSAVASTRQLLNNRTHFANHQNTRLASAVHENTTYLSCQRCRLKGNQCREQAKADGKHSRRTRLSLVFCACYVFTTILTRQVSTVRGILAAVYTFLLDFLLDSSFVFALLIFQTTTCVYC